MFLNCVEKAVLNLHRYQKKVPTPRTLEPTDFGEKPTFDTSAFKYSNAV
jgi:hypothetical protein